MPIVEKNSEIYVVVFGQHAGKLCTVWNDPLKDTLAEVIFCSEDPKRIVTIEKTNLCKTKFVGWVSPDTTESFTLGEYLSSYQGTGHTLVNMPDMAHPQTLRPNDILATGEKIVEVPRRGCNSSILVCLERIGWVEVAPRFIFALEGNKKFKLPGTLKIGDTLVTGCTVEDDSVCTKIGWVCIYVDGCEFKIPSCIPLALS